VGILKIITDSALKKINQKIVEKLREEGSNKVDSIETDDQKYLIIDSSDASKPIIALNPIFLKKIVQVIEKIYTPEIEIDYVNKLLYGFNPSDIYTINDSEPFMVTSQHPKVVIDDEWFDNDINIILKANSEWKKDTLPQTLHIPYIPSPPNPEYIHYEVTLYINREGGSSRIEYKNGDDPWTYTEDEAIGGIYDAGKFLFRAFADDDENREWFSSEIITIESYPIPDIQIDYRSEKFIGFDNEELYGNTEHDLDEGISEVDIGDDIFGQTVRFRQKGKGNHLNSDWKVISVPNRPIAPTITINGNTATWNHTNLVEVRWNSVNNFTAYPTKSYTFSDSGTFSFRFAATDNSFSSNIFNYTYTKP
jgi:hypothetical protein